MAKWRVGRDLLIGWGVGGPVLMGAYCVLPDDYVILAFPQAAKTIHAPVNYVYMGFKASEPCTREEIALYQALGFKTCGGRWLEYQQDLIRRHVRHIDKFEQEHHLLRPDNYFNYKELQ